MDCYLKLDLINIKGKLKFIKTRRKVLIIRRDKILKIKKRIIYITRRNYILNFNIIKIRAIIYIIK